MRLESGLGILIAAGALLAGGCGNDARITESELIGLLNRVDTALAGDDRAGLRDLLGRDAQVRILSLGLGDEPDEVRVIGRDEKIAGVGSSQQGKPRRGNTLLSVAPDGKSARASYRLYQARGDTGRIMTMVSASFAVEDGRVVLVSLRGQVRPDQ